MAVTRNVRNALCPDCDGQGCIKCHGRGRVQSLARQRANLKGGNVSYINSFRKDRLSMSERGMLGGRPKLPTWDELYGGEGAAETEKKEMVRRAARRPQPDHGNNTNRQSYPFTTGQEGPGRSLN